MYCSKVFNQKFKHSTLFLSVPYTSMKRLFFLSALTGIVALFGSTASAQYEDDPNNYDNYYDYDTTQNTNDNYDQGYDNYDNYDDYDQKPEGNKKAEKKPYVRIEMPYDTLTELITYTEVIVQEESYYDSLYWRAKRYLKQKFDLRDRDFDEESEKNMDKIIMTLQIPYMMKPNKFSEKEVGKLEFQLALRFKDGKYKYDIDHLRHNMPENAAGSTQPEYVYLEYYMRAERNIIYHDKLLRSADRQINVLIKEIKKALREPIIIDEDDW